MPHWDSRVEPRWKEFKFNQPYAKGLARLKNDVLGKTDFDPATLWQWGTMQAMALVGVLEAAEAKFGAEGQKMVADAVSAIGLDVGEEQRERAVARDAARRRDVCGLERARREPLDGMQEEIGDANRVHDDSFGCEGFHVPGS